jgi:hypothetical protein
MSDSTQISGKPLVTDSQKKIEEYVEQLLNDPEVNAKFLPDAIESRLYKNVLNLSVALMKNLLASAEIHVLGHKITLVLAPDIIPPAPPAPEPLKPKLE